MDKISLQKRTLALSPDPVTPYQCQECGDICRVLPRNVLAKKYGKEYASQTSIEPCSCLHGVLIQTT